MNPIGGEQARYAAFMVAAQRPVKGEALWLEPALASALLIVSLVASYGEPWPHYLWIDIVTCAGAAAAYRWPLVGASVAALGLAVWLVIPDAGPSVSGLGVLIVVFAAHRKNLSWRLPLTLVVAGLLFAVMIVRSGVEPERYWGSSLLWAVFLGVAVGSGALWHRRYRLLQQERERAAADLEEFRLELARDLHDTVAQTLSATAMRAHLALAETDVPGEVRTDLEWIAEQCRSSAHDLRQILGRLRGREPSAGEPLASLGTLRATVEQQVERLVTAGFTAESEVGVGRLSAARAQALSAVTVEAVNNMVRHAASGTLCRIDIRDDGDDVVATYTNTAGAQSAGAPGMGLTGVRERLALLGGTSEQTRAGTEWRLVARLPHGVEANPTG